MVLVTGDCHGNFARFEQKHFSEQANMTKDDTVIIAGDFGGVWFGDSRDDETLDWLERLPFTLAFVCGNHENYDALERYPVDEWHGGRVHRIRPHVLHLMRGQIFELEGCRFFTMGGAKSHDIRAVLHFGWKKAKLLAAIESQAWLHSSLDEQALFCYTEKKEVSQESESDEENTLCVPWQDFLFRMKSLKSS